MNGSDRNKAAADDALKRLEEDRDRTYQRIDSAMARLFAKVAAIAAGTLRPGGNDETQPR